jgi:hypothetical protein
MVKAQSAVRFVTQRSRIRFQVQRTETKCAESGNWVHDPEMFKYAIAITYIKGAERRKICSTNCLESDSRCSAPKRNVLNLVIVFMIPEMFKYAIAITYGKGAERRKICSTNCLESDSRCSALKQNVQNRVIAFMIPEMFKMVLPRNS